MKIVIVGAGIAGLSTCLLLKKHILSAPSHGHTVVIVDAYDIKPFPSPSSSGLQAPDIFTGERDQAFTPAAVGSAIGISPNGLAVLERLDNTGAIIQEIKTRGHSIQLWKMGDARGWQKIEFGSTNSKIIAKTRPSSPQQRENDKIIAPTVMITRQAMWEILRDAVVALGDDFVFRSERVVSVGVRHEGIDPSTVLLADGTEIQADLVIGADGLRSIVRQSMFSNETEQRISDNHSWKAWLKSLVCGKQEFVQVDITPQYEGLVGLAGFVPSSTLTKAGYESGTMRITFGPNGFFGYGNVTTPPSNYPNAETQSAWWSTFASPSPTPYAISSTDGSKQNNFRADQALSDLLVRHRWWKDPAIQAILDHCEDHGVTQCYPTYTTPELPTWEKAGRLVLVGDAAHTIQPSSGQGASQALEDAESVVLLLKHYLGSLSAPTTTSTSIESSVGLNLTAKDKINHLPSVGDTTSGTKPNGQTSITGSGSNSKSNPASTTAQAVAQALSKYTQLRHPRVHKIYARAQKMGRMKSDMNFVQEMLMYLFFWLMKYMHDTYNEWLFEYDVPSEVERVIGTASPS